MVEMTSPIMGRSSWFQFLWLWYVVIYIGLSMVIPNNIWLQNIYIYNITHENCSFFGWHFFLFIYKPWEKEMKATFLNTELLVFKKHKGLVGFFSAIFEAKKERFLTKSLAAFVAWIMWNVHGNVMEMSHNMLVLEH